MVDFTPKWAKPVALFGLRLNVFLAFKRGELTPEEHETYMKELERIERLS
jgi:hypothetical protein